jgi:hypothetical protein
MSAESVAKQQCLPVSTDTQRERTSSVRKRHYFAREFEARSAPGHQRRAVSEEVEALAPTESALLL